jgi:GNAT superfamily N-acetyltransferase
MNDTSADTPWTEMRATISDQGFEQWAFFEQRFGEFGEPGFTHGVFPATAPHITGTTSQVDVRIYFYRGEDGALLGLYGWYEDDGIEKPFFLYIHPDHQRMGIATKLIDYRRARYVEEKGQEYNFADGMTELKVTTAAASFGERYVKSVYSKEIEEQSQ